MGKIAISLFSLAILLAPASAFAVCTADGATVVYVNGIFGNLREAEGDLRKLEQNYQKKTGDYETEFYNGYNPSHLEGGGDLLKSIMQAYQKEGSFVADTDLRTILLQIHPQVTTQKIILVGHSQGTFYTNTMYKYLTGHGVSENSVAVYNIATPASFVEGKSGAYLTSATDKVINRVREAIKHAPSVESFGAGAALSTVKQTKPKDPLPPNTTFVLSAEEGVKENGGHSFSGVYLKDAPNTVVSTISRQLSGLTATADSKRDCFISPSETLLYKANKTGLGAMDYIAAKGKPALAFVRDFAVDVGTKVPSNMASAAGSLLKAITPAPRTTNLPGSHSVVSALYGSSITEENLREFGLLEEQGGAVALAVQKPIDELQTKDDQQTQAGEVQGAETENIQPAAPVDTGPLIPPPPSFGGGGGISPGFGGGAPTPAVAAEEPAPAVAEEVTEEEPAVEATSTPAASSLFTASTMPPEIMVGECTNSLSLQFCFIGATEATVSWSAVPGAVEYKVLVNGGEYGPTVSTSTVLNVPDQASSTLLVVAYDASSTALASPQKEVYAFAHPVVINEVAWPGTAVSADNQWIELKNRSPYDVDLSHAALYAADGPQYAPLSGTVFGSERLALYPFSTTYLVERVPEMLFFTSPPELVAPFDPLAQSGAQLVLAHWSGVGTTTLDRTPPVSACGGWCAGKLLGPVGESLFYTPEQNTITMERISATTSGELASNWADADVYSPVGGVATADAAHAIRIVGTPGVENSRHEPDFGFYCRPETRSIVENQSYHVEIQPEHPQSLGCFIESGFISYGTGRDWGVFRGTVGSSTAIGRGSPTEPWLLSFSQLADLDVYLPADIVAGEPLFVAAWEVRHDHWPVLTRDEASFFSYFETGHPLKPGLTEADPDSTSPPHSNYRVLHWTYAPQ